MPLHEVLTEYDRRRTHERVALEARTRDALACIPALQRLFDERKRIAADLQQAIRQRAAGHAASNAAHVAHVAHAAQEQLRRLDMEEAILLQQAGLPSDYLSLHVQCSQCGDTGYVGDAPRTLCVCVKKQLREEERASSHINEHETFELFDAGIYPTDQQRKQMRNACKRAEDYANALPNPSRINMVFLGMTGLGKSYLLNCIAARAIARGIKTRKLTAYTMFDEILAGIRQGANHAAPFLSVPLLLIDDLGTEPTLRNITREYLFSILNERLNGRLNTVVATNLSTDALQEQYGERVFSRMISPDTAEVLQLSGDNLRLFGCRKDRG